jgi:hypothetical protein
MVRSHDEEPRFGPGESVPISDVVEELRRTRRPEIGPFLLAIDGRSSNGKSMLARRLIDVVDHAFVVRTDDIAWRHSRFGWDDLLLTGIIRPLRLAEVVRYRPPAWSEHGRVGAITVPADAELVVIEGVGAGRASLRSNVDAVVWVQCDLDLAEQRNRGRIDAGEIDQAGYEAWMAEEVPFQAGQRTWDHADVVVSGDADQNPSEIVVLHHRSGSTAASSKGRT